MNEKCGVFVFHTLTNAKAFQQDCEERGFVTARARVSKGVYFVAVKEA